MADKEDVPIIKDEIESKTLAGFTKLITAASKGDTKLVADLIKKKADLNAHTLIGWSALFYAVSKNNIEVIELLLKSGADVNSVEVFGLTPLMIATRNGSTEIVKLLIDNGADNNIKDKYGKTALDFANQKLVQGDVKFEEIVQILKSAKPKKQKSVELNVPKPIPSSKISDDIRSLEAKAQQNYKKGDFESSLELLKEALKKESNYVGIYRGLTLAAYELKRYNDVQEYSDTWVKLDPTSPEPYNMIGLILLDRDKDYSNAADFFAIAIYLNNKDPVYFTNRGICFYYMKRYETALADFDKALAISPKYVTALTDRADTYRALGKKKEAIADLKEILKINPANVTAKNMLAQITGLAITDEELKSGEIMLPEAIIPKENFDSVAGMHDLKRKLKELIIHPFKSPELAKKYGIKAGGGILLYGPPGCGKTFIAKAAAGEAKANFIQARISDIRSMWSGQTSKNLHSIFEFARKNTPCVLFFDEVDALGGSRDLAGQAPWYREAVNTFLTEIDGANASNEGILILGATNGPWFIDSALKRSGRFDTLVYVPPPDKDARVALFKLYLNAKPLQEDIDYEELAILTNYYSAADIAIICSEAAKIPWGEALSNGKERGISMEDIKTCISNKKPTITEWYRGAKQYTVGDENTYADLIDSIREYEKSSSVNVGSYR
jgi:transitional endoplasmic reticulum ATPase